MAGMTTGPDTLPDKQDMLRMIDAARENGLSQASGPALSDKLAENFLAMVQLASMRLWLRVYESTT